MTIITCVIFSFLCSNGYSQYNEKFKELLSSKTFCEGSITPYGILAPYAKRVELKYIEVLLSFPEKIRVVFFVCVNPLGKAQEIHFIEASKHEDSYIIKCDSLHFEELVKIKSFLSYIEKMDFSPARGEKITYTCMMLLIFEAKRQRQIFGKKKTFIDAALLCKMPYIKKSNFA